MTTTVESSPAAGCLLAHPQGPPPPGSVKRPLGLARGLAPALLAAAAMLASGCVTTPEGGDRARDLLPVRCLEEPEPGVEQGSRIGYYYDYRTNGCKAFRYGGGGAQVPFQSQAECVAACRAED
mgnify:CR=1 FL=1